MRGQTFFLLAMSGVQSNSGKLPAESRRSGDDRTQARMATNVIASGTVLAFHIEWST
jgi:hypothetical protein